MKLIFDSLCGTSPLKSYQKLITEFNFCPDHLNLLTNFKQDNFGNVITTPSVKTINLKKVTPEKFDVWFISRHNFTSKKKDTDNYTSKTPNIVLPGDYSWISEPETEDDSDFTPRLVFIKNPLKYNGYTFAGIFRPSDYYPDTKTRKYIRVSKEYEVISETSDSSTVCRKVA